MKQTQRVLVLPDIHYPFEDKQTLAAVRSYAKDHKWDKVIQLGDLMDFNVISSHNIGNLRAVDGQSLQKDYAYANARLDEWQKVTPGAQWIILEGNHDYRIERYIDAHPECAGMLEVEKALRFKERGIKWVRNWSKGDILEIGKAVFIHGLYHNDLHAKSHVNAYGNNVFYGHLHDFQLYSKVLIGDNKTQIGQSLGCLCDYKQFYMKGRPNKWQQGFAVFHFLPNGFFTHFPVMIFDHKFVSPEGKVYDGKLIEKSRR